MIRALGLTHVSPQEGGTSSMSEPAFTREQYNDALAALGLDPDTTASVNLSIDWARVVHTSRDLTQGPIGPADTEGEGGDVD